MPNTVQLSKLAVLSALPLLLSFPACTNSGNDSVANGVANVAAGMAAVAKYKCKTCHGQDMSGSTTPYSGTMAFAANLTPDMETGIGEWDSATIAEAVLTGVDDEGATLCSVMPRFSTMQMSETDAMNIAAYLQSLPAVSKEVPESSCSNKTDSEGETKSESEMAGSSGH